MLALDEAMLTRPMAILVKAIFLADYAHHSLQRCSRLSSSPDRVLLRLGQARDLCR